MDKKSATIDLQKEEGNNTEITTERGRGRQIENGAKERESKSEKKEEANTESYRDRLRYKESEKQINMRTKRID